MIWPFGRRETRTSAGGNSDAFVEALLAQAEGTVSTSPGATAAVEACAGLYSRALASATVKGDRYGAVTPGFLSCVGREWIRRGEAVFSIGAGSEGVTLWPVGSWNIEGSYPPNSWIYTLWLDGPSNTTAKATTWDGVVHTVWATDPRRPWCGLSPMAYATATGSLHARLEQRLGQEAGGPVGHLLPIPVDGGDGGDDDSLATLKQTVGRLDGRIALTETTAGGWGAGMSNAPRQDWKPSRLGANPPATLTTLRSDSAAAILAACGVPEALVNDADGTSQREAYRRWVMASLEPVASCLAEELSRKLETPISFDFSSLWAHDLPGRTSALKTMVEAGIPLENAREAVGL